MRWVVQKRSAKAVAGFTASCEGEPKRGFYRPHGLMGDTLIEDQRPVGCQRHWPLCKTSKVRTRRKRVTPFSRWMKTALEDPRPESLAQTVMRTTSSQLLMVLEAEAYSFLRTGCSGVLTLEVVDLLNGRRLRAPARGVRKPDGQALVVASVTWRGLTTGLRGS